MANTFRATVKFLGLKGAPFTKYWSQREKADGMQDSSGGQQSWGNSRLCSVVHIYYINSQGAGRQAESE